MDKFDLIILLGVVLLTIGGYLIFPPLAFIIFGTFLLAAGIMGSSQAGA